MRIKVKQLNEYKVINYSKDFEYKVENDEVTITKYNGKEAIVTVPEEIEDYPVTVIDKYAFANSKIIGINLPNSITEIRESAFSSCEKLKEIILSNSITEIKDNAFMYCKNLTKIELPNSLTTLRKAVFSDCKKLKEIVIPNSITKIGKNAFRNCINLKDDIKNILINKWHCEI